MTSGFSMRAMTRSVAAALGAGLDVEGEDAFQALHPSHGDKGLIGLFVARFAFWHDGLTMLAIRREHAVEPGEVQSRTRDQRRRAGDEIERVEDDVGGAVAKRLLEPIDDLSPIVGREPLVGDGGPCDVATELFELAALGGFTDGGGVERKARPPGEQGGWEGFGLCRDGARGQCLPVGVGPDGDPVVDRGADELIESLTGLEVEVVGSLFLSLRSLASASLADIIRMMLSLRLRRMRCQRKVEMSPFAVRAFLFFEKKNLLPSCGVVGERRASVGSRWATRGENARSMATRPSALSTGCPHAPKGARRSRGARSRQPDPTPSCSASLPATTKAPPASWIKGDTLTLHKGDPTALDLLALF